MGVFGFFFNDTATTEIYTLSLHDALPISDDDAGKGMGMANEFSLGAGGELDNGWTWATNIDIDGATVQDDMSMTIGMGGLGSVKWNISDGGIAKNFGGDRKSTRLNSSHW